VADAAGDVAVALGHSFEDPSLLERALTHTSYVSEHHGIESNQRLEFLGDAVLGAVIADRLHADWDLAEGEMSKVRAAVVNEATLARVASGLGVGAALLLGRGEDAAGGRNKAPILADAMEALIGAVYLDGGFGAARDVIDRLWYTLLADRARAPGRRDYKTRLQEILATEGREPVYEVEASGPDHARRFRSTVSVGGEVAGSGEGTSKKRSEQEAAHAALVALGHLDA
jgi:ribonuclease-3